MADNGFGDSLGDELGSVSVELERIGDLADGVARSLSTAFRGALTDGKSFRSVLGDIASAFGDIALKAAIKPLGTLVGGLVENVFTAENPALAVKPFAKGGVIASPSYFPMTGGMGLMGEAGPEAIMPLQRGPDGRLGVAGGGGGGVNVTFNVTASDARSFVSSEADVSAMLLRAVRRGSRGA